MLSLPRREFERQKQLGKKRVAAGKRWSWIWKAFVHEQARGQFITPEVAAEFSRRYRLVKANPEDFAYYEELAEIAYGRYRQGMSAFVSDNDGKRRRRQAVDSVFRSIVSGSRSDSAIGPLALQGDELALAMDAGDSRIVRDAAAARQDAQREVDNAEYADEQMYTELKGESDRNARSVALDAHVVGIVHHGPLLSPLARRMANDCFKQHHGK